MIYKTGFHSIDFCRLETSQKYQLSSTFNCISYIGKGMKINTIHFKIFYLNTYIAAYTCAKTYVGLRLLNARLVRKVALQDELQQSHMTAPSKM